MSGFLVLEDGSVFRGRSVGALGVAHGEAVFTTAMTGYQEIVTDPSFAEQLVAFTAPMVGNYGVSPQRSESARTHARAVLMRRATGEDWPRWLHAQGVVALEEIDTRTLVVRLREHGAMRAAAVAGAASAEEVLAAVRSQASMEGRALVAGVSTGEPYRVGRGGTPVAVLDYGCKSSILRRLNTCGVQATVFPHDTNADTVLAGRPAGVLLSNGPGDPSALGAEVAVVRGLLGRVPLLGICLG
ncbi:MAG TPA: carbamoyl phosphate synthase small subunit, partial [Gaiellaceae bacterium]|nr:carbamoyl phosphate synthase small subunit [Gaiellaceae bacterium]